MEELSKLELLGRNLVSWSCCGSQSESQAIEYVVLAHGGLHFLRSQGGQILIFAGQDGLHGAAPNFSRTSTFFAPQNSIFARPQGRPAKTDPALPSLGSQLSITWKK